jgi:hypothetical protein
MVRLMATKRQTTFAKLDRERAVREKRARKQEKKEAAKAAKAAESTAGEMQTPADADADDLSA